MVAAANLVEVAALVGDTARATMLNALMDGQSLTATELAYCANVSRATASGHLSKLVSARLLTVTRNSRLRASRSSPPWRYRPAVSHGQQTTMHSVLPGVATIIWLAS